jgi:hypothetical protein
MRKDTPLSANPQPANDTETVMAGLCGNQEELVKQIIC